MGKITVFDQNNQRIGETFPRRAKQLIKNKRACWKDEDRNEICLLEEALALNKEDLQMEISNVNEASVEISVSESESVEAAPVSYEVQEDAVEKDLLMYLAKRNIRLRYNLLYHIIAWPVALIVIFFITNGFRSGVGFYAGFFFAWGLLILHKIYIVIRSWIGERPNKTDPIKAEYERLKAIPTEKIEAEFEKL
ncbi:MAG: hypothetical protein FWE24_11700 [Defluviitaleaceae bacterium]|nr:hypothetical protein [Defluviitaleaceae bacterium]